MTGQEEMNKRILDLIESLNQDAALRNEVCKELMERTEMLLETQSEALRSATSMMDNIATLTQRVKDLAASTASRLN